MIKSRFLKNMCLADTSVMGKSGKKHYFKWAQGLRVKNIRFQRFCWAHRGYKQLVFSGLNHGLAA